jgi:hypothetical protein
VGDTEHRHHQEEHGRRSHRHARRRKLLIGGGLLLASLLVLGVVLAVVFPGSGPTNPRAMCSLELRQLGLALAAYDIRERKMPPAVSLSADDTTRTSWRVLLLKDLGCNALFGAYRQDEPWDGPGNSRLRSAELPMYCCTKVQPGMHVAVTGPDTAWPPEGPRSLAGLAWEVPSLIVLVHLRDPKIEWSEPRDLDVAEFAQYLADREKAWFPSRRLGHAVLFADGQAWILSKDCPEEEIAKLFTITGAKKHNREKLLGKYHH